MCTTYEAVSRLERYLPQVKDDSVRDALETLLSSIIPTMLVPMKMPDGSIIQVSNLKTNRIPIYQKFCKDHAPLIQSLYLFGSALTEQCREKSDMDLMFVLNCTEDEWNDAIALYWEDYPDLAGDDWLTMLKEDWADACNHNGWVDFVVRDVVQKGVKIYDLSW